MYKSNKYDLCNMVRVKPQYVSSPLSRVNDEIKQLTNNKYKVHKC